MSCGILASTLPLQLSQSWQYAAARGGIGQHFRLASLNLRAKAGPAATAEASLGGGNVPSVVPVPETRGCRHRQQAAPVEPESGLSTLAGAGQAVCPQ